MPLLILSVVRELGSLHSNFVFTNSSDRKWTDRCRERVSFTSSNYKSRIVDVDRFFESTVQLLILSVRKFLRFQTHSLTFMLENDSSVNC